MTSQGKSRRIFTVLGCLVGMIALAWGGWRAVEALPDHLQPWTPLSLDHPINPITTWKLHALRDEPDICHTALEAAALGFSIVPARDDAGECGWETAVRITEAAVPYSAPQPLTSRCAMVAGLHMWETQVLIPAAQEHFGVGVSEIIHYGTYVCRPVYGREGARLSEHALANAIDIGGVHLEDGRTVTVLDGWDGPADEQAFLREVRDGACRLFRAVLGPDYNPAHADHFHFDMGRWRTCS